MLFISDLGIYNEVPGKFGEWNRRMVGNGLAIQRNAADIIEDSDLDYTIIRCAWMTNDDLVDYEVTQKGESFKGTIIPRKSIADLVVKIIMSPEKESHSSLGINQPNTDGDRPVFY